MKIFSTLCLLLAVACQAAGYYGMYSVGWLGNAWRYLNFFTLDPILFMAVVALTGAYFVSLFLRSSTTWCASMLCTFIVALCLQLYVLPPPVRMVMYGLRDHVLQVSSVEDLRHFARDFHQAIPYLAISHGAVESLDENQAAAYRRLQGTYSFMKWSLDPGEGPSIFERNGRMNVEWGGSTAGHWGFSITIDGARNESDKGVRAEILRVSDDIFFYRVE
jgi:hypothetical protein